MFSGSAAQDLSSPPMEGPPVTAGAAPASRAVPAEERTSGGAVAPPPPPCGSMGSHGGAPSSVSAPPPAAEKLRKIGAYAVQCTKCFKLRLIPTQEEYETIRHNFTQHPSWVCGRKPGTSCSDPADLDFDATSLWMVDKPDIPKTPPGCKRILSMRKDFTKLDAAYVMPNGKRLRSLPDVGRFLEAYPCYKDCFSPPDFRFTVPWIMEGPFPGVSMGKGSPSTSRRTDGQEMKDSLNV